VAPPITIMVSCTQDWVNVAGAVACSVMATEYLRERRFLITSPAWRAGGWYSASSREALQIDLPKTSTQRADRSDTVQACASEAMIDPARYSLYEYYVGFFVLLLLVLGSFRQFYGQYLASDESKSVVVTATFKKFQRTFLIVYLIMMGT